MASKIEWYQREKKLLSGRVVVWRERTLPNGEIEQVFDDEDQQRVSGVQPVTVHASELRAA